MRALHLNEEKLEVAQGAASAMKFLGEQEKKSKFANKRYQELERLVNLPNHTRSSVRVRFPDGYILQAAFGAKERVEDVLTVIKENLAEVN